MTSYRFLCQRDVARWEREEMRMQPAIDRLVRLVVAQHKTERQRGRKPRRRVKVER